jgi:hypothetical protein
VKSLAAATASLVILLGAAAATAAGTAPAITVTPHSVAFDSMFTIAFVTPAAAPTGGYDVRLRATVATTPGHDCVAHLDFYNPKPVVAHSPLRFAYVPREAEGLCSGSWTVNVRRDGTDVITGGRFTLHS